MEIKEYIPSYKKAIIDMVKEYNPNPKLTETTLKMSTLIGFVIFDKSKFKGFVVGAPIPNEPETVFVTHWQAKTKEYGVEVLLHAKEYVKAQGFKYAEYFKIKEGKYVKEEL